MKLTDLKLDQKVTLYKKLRNQKGNFEDYYFTGTVKIKDGGLIVWDEKKSTGYLIKEDFDDYWDKIEILN